jgi:outer membrane immunogenic protein
MIEGGEYVQIFPGCLFGWRLDGKCSVGGRLDAPRRHGPQSGAFQNGHAYPEHETTLLYRRGHKKMRSNLQSSDKVKVMRRLGFIGAAGLCLLAIDCAAADEGPLVVYPIHAPIAVPPNTQPLGPYTPVAGLKYDWTGFYLGINVGGGWGSSSWQDPLGKVSTETFSVPGWLVGGSIGYNWQFGKWAFGLEGDGDWSRFRGSSVCGAFGTCETRIYSIDTARGRIGYAFDRILPYVTAGLAIDEIAADRDFAVSSNGKHIKFIVTDTTNQGTGFGYVVGVGVEAAIYGQWTAKIEYQHVGFEKFNCGNACSPPSSTAVKFDSDILKTGLNFRF